MPNEIACTLTFERKKPVLATAGIGSALIPETIKTVFGIIGQKDDLSNLIAGPPPLNNFGAVSTPHFLREADLPLSERTFSIPVGSYNPNFLVEVKALGLSISEVPASTASGLRGELSIVTIDPSTGQLSSPEVPNLTLFSGAN